MLDCELDGLVVCQARELVRRLRGRDRGKRERESRERGED
jgi:hypothetical protein